MKSIDEKLRDGLNLVIFLTNNVIQIRVLCLDIHDGSINTPQFDKVSSYIYSSLKNTYIEEKKIYEELRLFRRHLKLCEGFNEEICMQLRMTHEILSKRLIESRKSIARIELIVYLPEIKKTVV